MERDELRQILVKGQKLLNISMSTVTDAVVDYSAGMPSVCHQIALNVCLVKGIRATQPKLTRFTIRDLAPAMDRYVAELSDTIKFAFDRATAAHNRRRLRDARPILSVLASGPVSGLRVEEILAKVSIMHPNYPMASLRAYLDELTQENYGNIVRHGIDDSYRFSEPIYHTFAKATMSESAVQAAMQPPGRTPKQRTAGIEANRMLLESAWKSSTELELVTLQSLVNQINVRPSIWTSISRSERDGLLTTMQWLQDRTPAPDSPSVSAEDPVRPEDAPD